MKNTLKDTAKQLAFVAACAAAAALCGCRSVEVKNYGEEFLVDKDGAPVLIDGKPVKCSKGWSVDHASHWLNTEADGISAEITPEHVVKFSMNGMKSSPSEEYNKMMATTMGAFVQMMQIAAAAYNPSASAASTAAKTGNDGGGAVATQTVVNVQPAAAVTTSDAQASTNAVESVEAK